MGIGTAARRVCLTFLMASFLFLPCHAFSAETVGDKAPGNGMEKGAATAAGEEEPVRSVSIRGRVVDDATGLPVPGARVSSFSGTVQSDGGGGFSLENIPAVRTAVINFRITDDDGSIIGCAYVTGKVALSPVAANKEGLVAVEVVGTEADAENVLLRLVPANGTGINDYCMRCHKPNPCLMDPGTDWSSVTHLGGEAVKQKEFEAIKAAIETDGIDAGKYPNLRYQDAHPQLVDIASVLKEGGKSPKGDFVSSEFLPLSENGIIVCDTCHTRHAPTDFQMFLRLDVVGENMLCRQCHG